MARLEDIYKNTKAHLAHFNRSFHTASGDKFVGGMSVGFAASGAICGFLLTVGVWPVALAGAVAGSVVLAVANWNGDTKSRMLSALIGFPLGAVFAPVIAGAMAGAYAGQKAGEALTAQADIAQQREQADVAATAAPNSRFDLPSLALRFRRAVMNEQKVPPAKAEPTQDKPPQP